MWGWETQALVQAAWPYKRHVALRPCCCAEARGDHSQVMHHHGPWLLPRQLPPPQALALSLLPTAPRVPPPFPPATPVLRLLLLAAPLLKGRAICAKYITLAVDGVDEALKERHHQRGRGHRIPVPLLAKVIVQVLRKG